jgi:hypothetical protein
MFLFSFIHDEKTEDEADLKKVKMEDEQDLKKEVIEDETDLKKEADVLNTEKTTPAEEQVEAVEAIELSPREEEEEKEAPSETTPLTNDSLENKQ